MKSKYKIAILSLLLAIAILEGGAYLFVALVAKPEILSMMQEHARISKVAKAFQRFDTPDVRVPDSRLIANTEVDAKGEKYYLYVSRFRRVKLNENRSDDEPILPNAYKIVITGNSTSMGVGASNNSAAFAAELQRIFREKYGDKIQVINYSTPEHGFLDEIFMYLTQIKYIKPNVWVVFNGDADILKFAGKLPVNLSIFQKRKTRLNVELARNKWLRLLPNFRKLLFVLNEKLSEGPVVNALLNEADPQLFQSDVDLYLSNLHSAIQLASGDGLQLVHAVQPALMLDHHHPTENEQSLDRGNTQKAIYGAFFEGIKRESRALFNQKKFANYHYIDTDSFLDVDNKADLYVDKRHYTDMGQKIIAEKLFEAIDPIVSRQLKSK